MRTVRVVKHKEAYVAVVEDVRALGLTHPPTGEMQRKVYAREIARRASYQLLSMVERDSWTEKESLISARPLVFQGMSRQDCERATPSDVIEMMLAISEKRLGDVEFALLRIAILQAWKDLEL